MQMQVGGRGQGAGGRRGGCKVGRWVERGRRGGFWAGIGDQRGKESG